MSVYPNSDGGTAEKISRTESTTSLVSPMKTYKLLPRINS